MLTRPLYTVNCNHHHNADFNNACCGQANDRKYFTNPRHVELLPLVILERRKHARVALLVVFVSAASRNRQYWHMCSHCGYGTSWNEWKDIHYRQARLVVVTTYLEKGNIRKEANNQYEWTKGYRKYNAPSLFPSSMIHNAALCLPRRV